ncbi:helix-turn-helix domain-containing protein [Leadbettera azotonutricia]|uniref:Uncharacterized protein n=1 Tax=Leadbettera azotonutricia (strain ATCC BAA-888 / DSM 13862 / ZAS-9) TaxID=545695 RepID=F5YD18_LEAAZ|nr:helix-turn-helix transcriptional regulator [Leadbettera azotonutricia]AEF82421.1 hypothetical protein TREAZ_2797 [Leadbettera azotonutricia ZAS-9]
MMKKDEDGKSLLLEALDRYIAKNQIIPDFLASQGIIGSVSAISFEKVESYRLRSENVVREEPAYEEQEASMLPRKASKKRLLKEKPDSDISSYIEIQKNKETFSVMLDRLRKERGLESPELYKAADIDRKLYSRIMGERAYKPSKNTVISFGLALKLSDSEMDALLESAGYTLSRSVIFDLIISFCMENMIYSIPEVNALLLARKEPLLRQAAR